MPYLPTGAKWKMEELCRRTIECLTGCKFISIRPNWLKNPLTGKNLELDAYNEDMRLALEYNGRQHYEFVPRFHRSQEDFEKQVYRDQLKKKLCDLNNVSLLIVPYTIPRESLCSYILNKLRIIRDTRRLAKQQAQSEK